MSTQTDEQQIRAIIDTWAEASRNGDLTALLNLMTEDDIFLTFFTDGYMSMPSQDLAASFKSMTESVSFEARSNLQEITTKGDVAVCSNLLEVRITPRAGGDTVKRAGRIPTAFRRGDDGQWRIANMRSPA